MTSQICVLNRKRSFAISDSRVTVEGCKTYDGEQKIFEISKELSTILMVSGNSRFSNQPLKNFVDEYVSNTNFNKIQSVEEIKNTLNESISQFTPSITADEYVESTFPNFEKNIKRFINQSDGKKQSIEFLKENTFYTDIDFLKDNKLLNSFLNRLSNDLFDIRNKKEFNDIKYYLKVNYFDYLIKDSPNFVIMGYDKNNDYPTYINYALLGNICGKLESYERYSVYNCKSTMIFAIAQSEDVDLNLMGYNKNSFKEIQNLIFELFDEFGDLNPDMMNSINNALKIKIDELKLRNIEDLIDYIEFLPDYEILNLLNVLIKLTSIKMKFSHDVHSVGGKQINVVLRKFEGIKFFN